MSDTIACPKCGQQTAPQFFKTVGKKQLCVLCAQRSDEANKALKESVEDSKLHGGYGWLWKHIAAVAGAVIGYLYFRTFIGDMMRSLFGGH